jgi:predicted AAA+ superfamily ATPase
MVMVAGPRQVGKTTMARRILNGRPGIYLSWDNQTDRREIRAARWPGGEALVVLDELHKWRGWKRWIKGEYDKHHASTRFLITGSARLDVYRRGGDSLQGRYRHYRLHPFSLSENAARSHAIPSLAPGIELPVRPGSHDALESLMRFSGFPEPFLAQSARTHRRWQHDRLERFFREDVRDLEALRELSKIQELVELLPDRIGSPLSLNAVREDLEVSHRAATHWMDVLERLYWLVRVRPFEGRGVRALRKMPKAYFWDWTEVPERGPRFENLVAMHLLKLCHYLRDADGYDVDLCYLRDRAGREVDFLVTHGRKPWFAVEAKLTESAIDPSLRYFRDRLKIPWVYQVALEGRRDYVENGVRCLPAADLLAALV